MSQTKKTVRLYDNSVTIHFNPASRNRYMIEETQTSPVGVTTILSQLSKGEGLMLWPLYEGVEWLKKHQGDWEGALKAYTIKSDSGKNTGSLVHSWIEQYLAVGAGVAPTPALEAQKACLAFVNWFEEVNPKVLATEFIIYSKKMDFAGTADALVEIDGKVVLVDVKTTNISRTAPLGIYPEMFLQLGGYALAHHEENPEQQIDDVMIVRAGKDGVLNTMRASDLGFKLTYLEDTFKQLVQVYKMISPLSKQLTEMEATSATTV